MEAAFDLHFHSLVVLDRTQGQTRNHIHAVVRTPNGNEYGKDQRCQHLEQHHSKQPTLGDDAALPSSSPVNPKKNRALAHC